MQNEKSSIEALYIQEFEKDVKKRVEQLGYEVKKCEVSIQIDASKENAGIHEINLIVGQKGQSQSSNIEIKEIENVEISINENDTGNNSNEELENKDTQEIRTFLSKYYEISQDCIKITQK